MLLRLRCFIPYLVIYCFTIFLLLYLPASSQSQVRTGVEDEQQRRLQASILSVLGQLAGDLNTRVHNGARTAQDILTRIDDIEATNPDSLLIKARKILGQVGSSSENVSQSPSVIPPPMSELESSPITSASDQQLAEEKIKKQQNLRTDSQRSIEAASTTLPRTGGSVQVENLPPGEKNRRAL